VTAAGATTTACTATTAGDPVQGSTMYVCYNNATPPAVAVAVCSTGTISGPGSASSAQGSSQFTEIFFGNRGSLVNPPFAEFVGADARNGFGPEEIDFTPVFSGRYSYAVQNFSNEVPITQSGARVQVFDANNGALVATFTVPRSGQGQWWQVFNYDPVLNQFFPVNQISNQPVPPSRVANQPAASATPTPTATITTATITVSSCQAILTQPRGANCTASGTAPSNAAVGSTVQVARETTNGTTVSTETFPCGTVATNLSFGCSYTTTGDPFQGATVTYTFALAGGGTTPVTLFTGCIPSQPQGVACRGPSPASDTPYRATQ